MPVSPPDPFVRSVARRIAAARVAGAMTQEALAEQLGIALKNVQRIESGRQNLTLQTLARIAKVLNVSPAELLSESTASPTAAPKARSPDARRSGVPFIRVAGPSPSGLVVPLLSLKAAAGVFGEARAVDSADWVAPATRRRSLNGMFVAQVEGSSMEPGIPAGAYVLFRAPVLGPVEGRVLLVQSREISDPETGGSYAVKRVGPAVRGRGGRVKVKLLCDNTEHPTVVVAVDDPGELRFVAELVEVLGGSE